MAKIVHFPASGLQTETSTNRSIGEGSHRDMFATIMLFSATGFLVSLIALLLGLPAIWF